MARFISSLILLGLSTQLSASPIMMSYYENWDTYATPAYPFDGAMGVSNPNLGAKLGGLNMIAYAFMEVDSSGSLIFSDPWSDLSVNDQEFCTLNSTVCNGASFNPEKLGVHFGNFDAFAQSSVPTKLISIGGANHDASWEYAMAHPTNFIRSLQAILSQYPNINGIDIDYEPAGGIPAANIQPFVNLVHQIRQDLPQITITMAYSANVQNIENVGAANWQALAADINYFGIMGYDMHGEFDIPAKTGLHSALYATNYSDDNAVQIFNKMGVPDRQLILGFPLYGRAVGGTSTPGLNQTFTSSYAGDLDPANCSTTLGSSNVCPGMMSYNAIYTLDLYAKVVNANGVTTAVYSNFGPNDNDFVSYDNPTSVQAKAAYVRSHHLAGMMSWAIRFDRPNTGINCATWLTGAADQVLGVQVRPYTPPSPPPLSTKLELHETSGNTAIVVSLFDSLGREFDFSVTAGQDALYCSKATASATCPDSWNIDNISTAKGTLVNVEVKPVGGSPISCGTLDISKSYNQVMSYAGSNCQISQ